SFSGAQVPSLWLPGPFKLGFDPARLTGLGQLERLDAQEAAFDAGRPGICALARSSGAGSIVLDVANGWIGSFDESPASSSSSHLLRLVRSFRRNRWAWSRLAPHP